VAKQLTLDLGHRPALGRDDFLVTHSNAAAVALVDQWPRWPSHGALLLGPAGGGKSHLAEVWRQVAGGNVLAAKQLQIAGVPELMSGRAVVLEDVAVGGVEEVALFHLLNQAQQIGGHVLLTAKSRPDFALPDLASRLSALPVATILPADDALLRGVLVKQFNDRQITVDEGLVSYLMTRMPRSLDTARQLVAQIDAEALEQGAEVTKAFAGRVLTRLESLEIL
jgi:chromosomal replication initiation ATPase DnaA